MRAAALLAAIALTGAGLLAGGAKGLVTLDGRLETETSKPAPVRLELGPHRGHGCPERPERRRGREALLRES